MSELGSPTVNGEKRCHFNEGSEKEQKIKGEMT